MLIQVPGHDSYKYLEVWEILAFKDGAIYKTRKTGKYIKSEDSTKLDPKKYTTSSLSTNLTRQSTMTLEMFEL